jgi:hypothetical protein
MILKVKVRKKGTFGPLPHSKKVRRMFKQVDHMEIVPRRADETIDFYVNISEPQTTSLARRKEKRR